jgi:hypothetical protein|tara:strand:+ start:1511 stop:1747 length:237 start_codon:yes stop_codon:yes gene_type:complete
VTTDTASGQQTTVFSAIKHLGCVMKKDKKILADIRRYLDQLQAQHRCGLIIADHRAENEIYKDKFLRLLEIIGPLAKA